MTYSYLLNTNSGLMRLYLPDRNETEPIFQDEELDAFYLTEGNLSRALAAASETIAMDQALTLKVIKLLQLQTDGAKLAEVLLKRAAILREQAKQEDAALALNFGFANWNVDVFTHRELLYNSWLRELI